MREKNGPKLKKVVFFDGECLLCSGTVKWAHQQDRRGCFWFASLASRFASEHREELGLPEAGGDAQTFVLWDVESGEIWRRSDGALRVLSELGGLWAGLATLGRLWPKKLRDWVYDVIAANRRSWFGESEKCALPPASLQGRVLE